MLGKIKRWLRFRRHDDAYTKTKQALMESVLRAIQTQLEQGKSVWLVTHFPDTFLEYQTFLAESKIDYQIADQALHSNVLQSDECEYLAPGQVHMVLSALIPEIDDSPNQIFDQGLSVLVVERHPLIKHDQRIHAYCKRIGAQVGLGYFQSFEDSIVAEELSEITLVLMEQMGMNDHSLVNSMTITRRIDRKLKRMQKLYSTDIAADNLDQWYELNPIASKQTI